MKQNFFRLWLSAGLAGGSVAGEGHAAEKVEQVVVTGAYSPVATDPVLRGVTVISRSDLDKSGKTNITDVLRLVAGVNFRQGGGAGGVSELNIRGSEANFVLVLVDGVKVNDSNNSRGGGFNFNSISLADVERIEILRGVRTAVYGGEGLSGVVNIITRTPEKPLDFRGLVEVGQDEQHNVNVAMGSQQRWGSASISAASTDRGDQIDGSYYTSDQLNLGTDWQWSENGALSWRSRYLNDVRKAFPEQSGGDRYASLRDLEEVDSEESAHYAAVQQQFFPAWTSKLALGLFDREVEQDSPGIVPFTAVPPNRSGGEYSRKELQWTNTLGQPEKLWLNTGGVVSKEKGESRGDIAGMLDTSYQMDRENLAVFAEGNVVAAAGVTTQVSVRRDEPEFLTGETSGSIAVAMPVTSVLDISVDWGKGFKPPSFFALGHPLVGNPELKPERAETWDLRLSSTSDSLGMASLTYSDSRYEDLIDFDPALFTNINRSEVDIKSVEFIWAIAPVEPLNLSLGATWLDIDTNEEGVQLSGRPEKQLHLKADYAFAGNTSAELTWRYVGEQYDTSLRTGATVGETLQSHQVWDMNFKWQINSHWQARFALDNVLDEDYQEALGFTGYGRTLRLQFGFRT